MPCRGINVPRDIDERAAVHQAPHLEPHVDARDRLELLAHRAAPGSVEQRQPPRARLDRQQEGGAGPQLAEPRVIQEYLER